MSLIHTAKCLNPTWDGNISHQRKMAITVIFVEMLQVGGETNIWWSARREYYSIKMLKKRLKLSNNKVIAWNKVNTLQEVLLCWILFSEEWMLIDFKIRLRNLKVQNYFTHSADVYLLFLIWEEKHKDAYFFFFFTKCLIFTKLNEAYFDDPWGEKHTGLSWLLKSLMDFGKHKRDKAYEF